ncbi:MULTISPECIES: branched-chain amino acid ABC transporter permease [Cytobacillus]|uniref:Branched-chain amino acid ABC transporter permease n=1 Tax=Cytobacillus kochii TaxID=859143 RepID=A0A248TE38_9BACI|nr:MULTISPECIES: branched-chain amino acid ABC transporter permease [Cytobacillus]ASV66447.1 branched-chain amino acid ABC transporter permease [Cytobacillus kochii]MDQ0187116.1 branched-chain amino acid transport system permease protein [Cytobacillus kochii]MEA1854435.1 branched-chain amino acid ABC transporter permease [Cytobacillus sp. OWB-43]
MLAELINPYYLQVGCFILINIILGISVYITLSTGQLSLANAGFMGIGAYTSALLTIHFELPIIIGIIIGALVAALCGVLIGIPTLRLQGVYLAIVTLGFGEVIRVIFVNWESVTNGSVGISGIPHIGREILKTLQGFGFQPSSIGLQNNQFIFLSIFILLLLITIFVIWFFRRQHQSRVGRAFAAIKLDEKAAESMGINITYYKVLAFAQGALVAGFAGAMYAHILAYISPADFAYHRAVEILIFVVFGGSEVIWGPIFGAFFLTLMPEVLRFISEYRYMIYGLIIIIMMAVRPQGLIDVPLLKALSKKGRKRGQKHGTGNHKSM